MENDKNHKGPGIELTEKEQEILLELARNAIVQKLQPDSAGVTLSEDYPVLKEERGLFVTLHKNSALRGCIGHLIPMAPLLDEVQNLAKLAAFEDPRFPSVSITEVADLHLEITILSPMYRIDDPETVIPGKHGLLISRGYYQGILLPQVASERGWDRETFLEQTCIKAGLRPDDWRKSDTEISVFTAYIFSE